MNFAYSSVAFSQPLRWQFGPEIRLAHGGGEAVTDFGGPGGGRVHCLLVASQVAEITAALVTVVSVDAVATYAILLGTLSSSASMGSNIRLLPVRPTVSLEKKLISRPPE